MSSTYRSIPQQVQHDRYNRTFEWLMQEGMSQFESNFLSSPNLDFHGTIADSKPYR